MKKKIIISEEEKKNILNLYGLQTESLSNFDKENFGDYLKKIMDKSGQRADQYGSNAEVTPENFDEAWGEIKRWGEYFASFGDSRLYVGLINDYMVSDVASAILDAYPVIDKYSNFQDFKKSKYYLITDYLFRPNYSLKGSLKQTDKAMETGFNYAVRSFGDLIIKNPFITKPGEPDKVEYNPHGIIPNLTHAQKSIVLMNLHRLHHDANFSMHDLDDWTKDLVQEPTISARSSVIADEIKQKNPKTMEDALEMLKDNHMWKGITDTIKDEKVIKKYMDKIQMYLDWNIFNPIHLNE